jgi:hypothetical protein
MSFVRQELNFLNVIQIKLRRQKVKIQGVQDMLLAYFASYELGA